MREDLRVAAYAVCVRDGQVPPARWVARDGGRRWTLPGGGRDHGEDPCDTVIREVEEETGCGVEPTALLGVDNMTRPYARRLGAAAHFQALRLVYEARVTGGDLRHETDGSTDLAAWHRLDAVPSLERVGLVDIGLALWRDRPPSGHLNGPVPNAPRG